MIQFKLTEEAKALSMIDFAPRRATFGAAGYDLRICSAEPIKIFPGEFIKLHTGICMWIGSNKVDIMQAYDSSMLDVAIMTARSSLKGLQLTNAIGVIDEDYQGEYLVSVYNYTDETIVLQPGVRIVQVIFTKAFIHDLIPVEEFSHDTMRGTGGFGHTGGTL